MSLILITGIGNPAFATTFTGDLFYTTFGGGTNIHKVSYTYDNSVPSFTLSNNIGLGSTPGADGIVFNPNNGRLLVGAQGPNIHQVIPTPFSFTTVASGTSTCYHVSVDSNNNFAWCGGIPGDLGKVPINPFAAGSPLNVIGAVSGVDSLAFYGSTVFFTSSGGGGTGATFGTIDLTTGVTTAILTGIEAHGMVLDPFTTDLILFGDNTILQIDPDTPNVIKSSKTVPENTQFDQGTVDGLGHLFLADNTGELFFMDYTSGSNLVGNAGNFLASPFLANQLDDIAPLVGPGSEPPTAVGGTIMPIDMTSLLVAGASTNAFWLLPLLGGVAATGLYIARNKFQRLD